MRPETYRKKIARLRARLSGAKNIRTLHAMHEHIRRLAAVLTTGKSGGWYDIPLEEACRITKEAPGKPPKKIAEEDLISCDGLAKVSAVFVRATLPRMRAHL